MTGVELTQYLQEEPARIAERERIKKENELAKQEAIQRNLANLKKK